MPPVSRRGIGDTCLWLIYSCAVSVQWERNGWRVCFSSSALVPVRRLTIVVPGRSSSPSSALAWCLAARWSWSTAVRPLEGMVWGRKRNGSVWPFLRRGGPTRWTKSTRPSSRNRWVCCRSKERWIWAISICCRLENLMIWLSLTNGFIA